VSNRNNKKRIIDVHTIHLNKETQHRNVEAEQSLQM
jgi:hypothetical protein